MCVIMRTTSSTLLARGTKARQPLESKGGEQGQKSNSGESRGGEEEIARQTDTETAPSGEEQERGSQTGERQQQLGACL